MLSAQEEKFMKDAMRGNLTKAECEQIILISRCSNFHNLTVFDVHKEYNNIEADLQKFYQEIR